MKTNISDSLLIIDMQTWFLPETVRINKSLYKNAKELLIKRIKERILLYLDNSKSVYLVEFTWHWDTVDEIKNLLWNSPKKLSKNSQDLLGNYNQDKNQIISELSSKWNKIELTWISASRCVLKTNYWLINNWFNTNIRINCILNFFGVWGSIQSVNWVKQITDDYKKFYDLSSDTVKDLSWNLDLLWNEELQSQDKYIWEL